MTIGHSVECVGCEDGAAPGMELFGTFRSAGVADVPGSGPNFWVRSTSMVAAPVSSPRASRRSAVVVEHVVSADTSNRPAMAGAYREALVRKGIAAVTVAAFAAADRVVDTIRGSRHTCPIRHEHRVSVNVAALQWE